MSNPWRRRWRARGRPTLAALVAFLICGPAGLGDDLDNRRLLETLPRDRRAALAENLERFDRLPMTEREAIRRLDAQIAALDDPLKQARYRAQLQHFHLWFQGLPAAQREALLAIPEPAERFAAARKIRLAQAPTPIRGGPRVAGLRAGDFGLEPPFEMAYLVKTWLRLAPEQRAEVDRLPPAQLRDQLRAKGRELKVPRDGLPAEQEKAYDLKLERDDEFRALIDQALRRDDSRRKADPKKAEAAQKRFERPSVEFLHFEEHRPRAVDPARLERFAAAGPDWLRAATDSLGPDDAQDYYTILYRLVYPFPAEIPDTVKPAAGPAPARKPAAGPGRGEAPTTPF